MDRLRKFMMWVAVITFLTSALAIFLYVHPSFAADVNIKFTISFDPSPGANGYAVYFRKKETTNWVRCDSDPFEEYTTDGKTRIHVTSTTQVPASIYSYYEATATAIGGPNNSLESEKAIPVSFLIDLRAPATPLNLALEGGITVK